MVLSLFEEYQREPQQVLCYHRVKVRNVLLNVSVFTVLSAGPC